MLCGCSTGTVESLNFWPHLRFSERPFGEAQKLVSTTAQSGKSVATGTITRTTFREITIAQGSGLEGFDVIRIYADGTGYATVGDFEQGTAIIPLSLPAHTMEALHQAIKRDRPEDWLASYSSDLHDGAQGFAELQTSAGSTRCLLNNYFVPVRHLYAFCNEQVWPIIKESKPRPKLKKDYSRQVEYYRVFPKSN
ncbi:hypothetical protein BH11VER1_BH11VER1_06060 [soil metagenome]